MWATERVIVGVTATYLTPEEEGEMFGYYQPENHGYLLDVQGVVVVKFVVM